VLIKDSYSMQGFRQQEPPMEEEEEAAEPSREEASKLSDAAYFEAC